MILNTFTFKGLHTICGSQDIYQHWYFLSYRYFTRCFCTKDDRLSCRAFHHEDFGIELY